MQGSASDFIKSAKNLEEFQTKVYKVFQDAIRIVKQGDKDKLGETMLLLDELSEKGCFTEESAAFYSLLKTVSSYAHVSEKDSDYPLALISNDLKQIKDLDAPFDKNLLREAFGTLAMRGLENEIKFVTEQHAIDPFALDAQIATVESIKNLLPADWQARAKAVVGKFYAQVFEWEKEHLEVLSLIDGKPWEFFTKDYEIFANLNAIAERWKKYTDKDNVKQLTEKTVGDLLATSAPNFLSLIGDHLHEILISLEKTEINDQSWPELWEDLHAVKYSVEAMWRAKQFLNEEDQEKFANDMNSLQSYSSLIVSRKFLLLLKASPFAKERDIQELSKIKDSWKDWLKEGGKLESEIDALIKRLK
jgi:hypothetical protein